MNDFERALSDALKQASETYRPSDPHGAKERFLQRARRRRFVLASGGVALAGATAIAGFLFFTGDAVERQRPEPLPAAAEVEETTEITVGDRPSGVAFGDGLAWVANAGDGTVMTIDPETQEVDDVFDVGGDPDDIAVGVGAAWVSDSGAGTVTSITLPSFEVPNDPVVIPVGEPGSTHMDIAPGANALWVAKDDSVWRIDPMSLQAQQIPTIESPTDVAVGDGSVYVLGGTQLARVDPSTFDVTSITTVASSRNQDLAYREGYLWLADGDSGEVTRIDPATGDRSSAVYVGGNFSGIAVDAEAVWVISGGTGDEGVLTRIDPDTLAPVLPRAELPGRPYDITLGARAVWIANQSAGTVTAIRPDDLPNEDGGELPPGDPVFAFAADGDVWLESFDGRLSRVTDTVQPERSPTVSPDGRYIAFVRDGNSSRFESRVILRDLQDGSEVEVEGTGVQHETGAWSPAFGPDGRLAWVQTTPEGDVLINVGEIDNGDVSLVSQFPAIAGYGAPNDADNLTWDLDGTYLYYNAGWEGYALYQADPDGDTEPFDLTPANHRESASYLFPSVRSPDGVHVVRVCCQPFGDVPRGETTTEIGMIRFTEGGPRYETMVELDPQQAAPVVTDFDSAGNLGLTMMGPDRTWEHTVVRSWLFATPRDIWLVNVRGRAAHVSDALVHDLGPFGVGGLETFPDYDD